MGEPATRRDLRICEPCYRDQCEACERGPCLCACRYGKTTVITVHAGVNHFCARCGQCLCPCKDCAVNYPCCCRACWEATAPRPPVTTVHNCTCAPKAVTA